MKDEHEINGAGFKMFQGKQQEGKEYPGIAVDRNRTSDIWDGLHLSWSMVDSF